MLTVTSAIHFEHNDQVKLWAGNECHVMAVSSKEVRRMKRLREPVVDDWIQDLVPVIGAMEDAFAVRRGVNHECEEGRSDTKL